MDHLMLHVVIVNVGRMMLHILLTDLMSMVQLTFLVVGRLLIDE